MAGSVRKFTAAGVDRGRTLAWFLSARLGVTHEVAARLIRSGATYVDRRRIEDPDQILEAGQKITTHVGPFGTARQPAPNPGQSPQWPPDHTSDANTVDPGGSLRGPTPPVGVRYRDKDALVVEKPAGTPTQATRHMAVGALDRLVQEFEPGARLVHRLDRDASGLVLFSRTAAARRQFARLLAERSLVRIYTAVVWGHVALDQGCVDAPVGPDPRDRRRMTAGTGRPAQTHFRVLQRGRTVAGHPSTLVELELVTGRTHQIRVHMAYSDHPLLGDALYAGSVAAGVAEPTTRLCLHATELAWSEVRVRSPAPPAFADLVLT